MLTFVLTVIFDLVVAIAAGLMLACLLFMRRMADVAVVSEWKYIEAGEADNGLYRPVPEGVMVYEINGPMFFAAADKIPHVAEDEKNTVMILRMRAVPALDVTAMNGLVRLREECRGKGIHMIFSHVNEQPKSVMDKAGFTAEDGECYFAANIDEALALAGELTGVLTR